MQKRVVIPILIITIIVYIAICKQQLAVEMNSDNYSTKIALRTVTIMIIITKRIVIKIYLKILKVKIT